MSRSVVWFAPFMARSQSALCGAGLLLAAHIAQAEAQLAIRTPARAFVASGDAEAPECKDALLLAQSMPRAKAPDPRAPLVLPRTMRSTLALGRPPDAAESSLLLASEEFERLSLPGPENAYWAKRVEAGKRIAVATSPRDQQSKWYSLYLLDDSVSMTDFRAEGEAGELRSRVDHFFTDTLSPLLFSLPDGSATWLLDMRPQEHHLQDWQIYASPVSRHVCTITVRFNSNIRPAEIIVN